MEPFIVELQDFWYKLKHHFGVDYIPPQEVKLIPRVQPVYDVSQLEANNALIEGGVTTVTANGYVTIGTVPEGKRWLVSAISSSVAGDFSIDHFSIKQVTVNNRVMMARPVGGGAESIDWQGSALTLDAGWTVDVNVCNYLDPGPLTSTVQLVEKDV